jgi:hypothetical protein
MSRSTVAPCFVEHGHQPPIGTFFKEKNSVSVYFRINDGMKRTTNGKEERRKGRGRGGVNCSTYNQDTTHHLGSDSGHESINTLLQFGKVKALVHKLDLQKTIHQQSP